MKKYFRRPRQWGKEWCCPELIVFGANEPIKTLHVEVWGNKMNSKQVNPAARCLLTFYCVYSTVMFSGLRILTTKHYFIVLDFRHWIEIIVTKLMLLIVLLRVSRWIYIYIGYIYHSFKAYVLGNLLTFIIITMLHRVQFI